MVQFIKVSSNRMRLMGQENIIGLTKRIMRANGSKIKCTGAGCLCGPTGKNTMEILLMIRERGTECLLGKMVECIKVNGKMENNTAEAFL